MSSQLLIGAVAYNLDDLPMHQQEIDTWRQVSQAVLTVPCPGSGCSVQYRLLVPADAFNAEVQQYKEALATTLQASCPYHPGRVRLKPRPVAS